MSPGRQRLRRFFRSPGGVAGLILVVLAIGVALLADVIAPGNPLALDEPALRPPSSAHWLGTDNLGRDLYTAVVHGMRTSLYVVLWTIIITSLIGLPLGILAGYRTKWLGSGILRVTELAQAFPRFYLGLLVVGLFGGSTRNLILVLALTSWTSLTRVARAETLAVREREFVVAANSYGASDWHILRHHVVPHVMPSAVVLISLLASRVILIEAGLSFLGLADQTRISLGFLASNSTRFLQTAWWMSVMPGLAIAIAVLGFNLFGDGLSDALRPGRRAGRQRRRRRRPELMPQDVPVTAGKEAETAATGLA